MRLPATEIKDPGSSGREVLAYLASYYGLELQPANPGFAFLLPGKRMSFAELTDSTKALGFEVHNIEDRSTALNPGPQPLLVGFGKIGYGVVLHASSQDVMFFEPHTALSIVPRDFFESLWDGRAVRVVPPALL
jgi:ABC-type bacteriocin/lantibiotic exporter with double-glycine peptidase domain